MTIKGGYLNSYDTTPFYREASRSFTFCVMPVAATQLPRAL